MITLTFAHTVTKQAYGYAFDRDKDKIFVVNELTDYKLKECPDYLFFDTKAEKEVVKHASDQELINLVVQAMKAKGYERV